MVEDLLDTTTLAALTADLDATDVTRETYILQYAPDGAVVAHDDPELPYRVLRNGEPIGSAG